MAYASLDSVAKKLDWILDHENDVCLIGSDSEDRSCDYCFLLGNKKQTIQSLHENVVILLDFVEAFPGEVGNLEARLENAAKQAKATFEIGYSFQNAEKDPRRELVFQDLDKLIEEVDSILQEALQIKRSQACGSLSSRHVPKGKETIVGFEKELIEIKDRLCGEPSQLQIIPIVGMGGIGKTTLARYVYDDPLTIRRFDVHAWVTISQNYSVITILSSILCSIDPSNRGNYQRMGEESLVQHGHRYLKKRRYLIVMDDIWDTNVWDDVRRAFPDDYNGSRIITTTRSLDVASYVGQPYRIQLMSEDQSWRLLKEVVFGQELCPPELEQIGKLIAEKCRGLPLAIVVIAGVLSKLNQMQESWEKIASNVSESVNKIGEQFSDILSVSYMHLPHHLRPCFLYMGCFPEDYEINISKLIRLWVGEGFLISSESKDMEELGYEYLDDLAKRSLVLIEKKRYNGEIKAVKIHDVLRDLCLRKCRDENFLHVINDFSGSFPEGIEKSHRLSICSNVWSCIPNMECAAIRTILFFSRSWAFDYWKHFRHLRVLDAMAEIYFKSYPVEISELIHLRYLAFIFEPFDKTLELEVPESLSKLQSLQTLVIRRLMDIPFTAILPIAIWRMPQLRHVMLLEGFLPDPSTKICQETSPLENLHTLSRIRNFTCSEMILDILQNLKKLGISYSVYDIEETGWSQYGLTNLIHLHKLEKLNVYVPPYLWSKSDVSEILAFPMSLRKLTLTGCRFPWEDMRIIGSLPNLEVLKLKRRACHGTIWETTEGEFCQLKVLVIKNTDLCQWITESSHFPRLERLTLYVCNDLEEIPTDIGEIPTLQVIEVDVRNLSVVQSAKCIQEEQQSFGNDLQVSLLKPRSIERW
ncbi:hypothetical protein C2S51_003474 [Perilla frutescens var. frutescens]|nr:hypothetical protein C2S51_003474 [Perilla frutescens var. frutescens]